MLANVAQPVVDRMADEGAPFHGILFCGIMLARQPDGSIKPMVLEFNTRFGDPETEAILVRLENDIVDLFDSSINGTADQLAIKMRPGASVCVIAASGGYPGKVVNGMPISGLNSPLDPTTVVFHAGTAAQDGAVVTAGGRVLAVTSVSDEQIAAATTPLQDALAKAYAALEKISFEGMQFRRNIAWRALRNGL